MGSTTRSAQASDSKYSLSEEKIRQMIDVADGIRDRLIIELLTFTGCRRGELIRIKVCNVDLDGDLIYVPTLKRRCDPQTLLRPIPIINNRLKQDLITYLELWKTKYGLSDGDRLLQQEQSRSKNGLSNVRVNQIISHLARQAVWAGFLASILLVLAVEIAIAWPAAVFWEGQEAFQSTLRLTSRIVLASLVAYLISQNWDILVFDKLKKKTKGKHLWLRNCASTMTSQGLDTIIFITIAFYGVLPVIPLIIGQYVVKLIIAAIDTPFLYAVKWAKEDLLDIKTKCGQ